MLTLPAHQQREQLLREGQHPPATCTRLWAPLPTCVCIPARQGRAPSYYTQGLGSSRHLPARSLHHSLLRLVGSPPACSPSGRALPGQPGPGSASTWSPPEVPVPPDASPCIFVDPELKSNLGKVPEHCLSRYSLLLPASGQTWGDGGDHSVEDARSSLAQRP